MPTYDYACKECGHQFELFQSMTARVKRKCPQCGKNGLERLIGAGAGFLFKGDGFYITDYRSEGYKSDAKEDKKAPEKESTSKDSKGASAKASDSPKKSKPSASKKKKG